MNSDPAIKQKLGLDHHECLLKKNEEEEKPLAEDQGVLHPGARGERLRILEG